VGDRTLPLKSPWPCHGLIVTSQNWLGILGVIRNEICNPMNPAPPLPHELPQIPGYTIVETLYLGARTAVYRAIQTAQQQPVVIKLLHKDYPSFSELVQFRNQYTIAKNLTHPGIVHPLSLEALGSGYALVMEDWGGVSLSTYMQQQSLGLAEVLAIALQVTDILQDLTQHQVVHKDIKPANILIHPESKQVKLIDFSIASLLPKETQEIQSPNLLEGTLAYLAPEQTRRMNRGIDYRADFYALGVTLYQLLSGTLPFTSEDPLELVHCHIAQQPKPVNQVNAAVPEMVAAIVTKLMAKNAEDRYQSAIGLKHDLQQCLTQWKETGAILAFDLGQRDLSDRFLIPEKLYGRENEVQTLLEAFDLVTTGQSEFMLVAGFSGIGKTAIVNEVHKPITRQNGYFIKGKFDQFNRNIPLSAFVQALRDLMGQLLSESDAQLAQWKQQILAVVESNGQVLIEVIPELEQIIGQQPAVPELSGSAAQNRFNLLFPKFIEVFSTPDHPLVIFLDDLQWADSASLQLIKLLMNDNGYLLMVGAYRDNEVSAAHPFILTVDDLQKAGTIVNTITLTALDFADVNHLIADTLSCQIALAKPLTELVMQKTQGNPFFLTQFLRALHDDGQITFNQQQCYWECDIAGVKARSLTDDVVEFMAQQLQKLPVETQEILKLAACIGNQFDLNTLAIVSEQSPTEAATVLWKGLQEGLILPQSEVYKFYLEREDREFISGSSIACYKFLHDRVQQAAYSLIPEMERAIAHYQIGQLLLQKTPIEAQEENIFALINQLNYGIPLITHQDERDRLAQLNLTACRKARTSTAYKAAQSYAIAGLQLLGEQAWQRQYDLTLALHHLAAETSALGGEYEQMEHYFEAVIQSAQTPLDRVNVYLVKIEALASNSQPTQAIAIGQIILSHLGVSFPQNPVPEDIQAATQAITELMGDRPIESLFDLPKATDAQQIAVIQIAASLTPVCYITGSPLFPLMVALQVQRSMEFGNSPMSVFGYVCYGILLNNVFRNVEAANQFGQLAYRLALEPDAKNSRASTLQAIANFLWHRKSHLRESIKIFQDSYQVGLETGALEHVGYSAANFCLYAFWCGQTLGELESQMQIYHALLLHLNLITTADYCAIYWDITLTLLEQPKPASLDCLQSSWAEAKAAQKLAAEDFYWLHVFYLHRFVLSYWLGDFAQAEQLSISARQYLSAGAGIIGEVIFYFYDSLTALSEADNHGARERALQRVQDNQVELKHWADYTPMNHLHKWQLVEAETQRVMGDRMAALEYYDRAIAGANANEYIQEEALANELAAKFYLDWGKEKVAAGYMQEAYYCYTRWGAKAKTDDLETRYPQLLQPIFHAATQPLNVLETLASIAAPNFPLHRSTQPSRSSSTSVNAALDFTAILKASQSLAGTIQLDELLQQLTQIILQNSGGDRCALILPNSDKEWSVVAIATPTVTELCSETLKGNAKLPVKLIQYVKNTQDIVIIDQGKTELPVIGQYLSQHQPNSVLCVPILNQAQLVGILYVENRATSGAFTSDRLLVLNFLCTQAAISLENARLYAQGQASQRQLTTLISNLTGMAYSCANDTNWTMQFISPGCFELTGYTPEEFILNHTIAFADLIHPGDVQLVDDAVQLAIVERRPFQMTYRIHTKYGEEKWVWEQGRGVFDANDQLIALEGLITDISEQQAALRERHAAEAALSESETYHRHLLEQSAIGFVLCRLNGEMVYANRAYCHIVGRTFAEICALTYWELTPEKYAEAEQVQLQHLQTRETYGPYEKEYLHKDGHLVPVRLSGLIVERHGEQFIWSNVEDISDRKFAEATILQKSQALEQALQDLQNAQLQTVQSEKMASLGNLVAGVAHEINNPIGFLNGSINNGKDYVHDLLGHLALYQQHYPNPVASIQDHAEDIDLEFLREDLPKLLDSMKGATDRIKGISTSLRTFSRADTEHTVSANLHDGLDSTLLILKYRLKANEFRPAIKIIKDYGEIPAIACFPGQLNQVFMNILANAIDMFDEMAQTQSFDQLETNSQQITICTRVVGNQVQIRIQDNGKGMTEDVKAKIFDHLFTTKEVGKGTGMGLAIARQIIVQKHEGAIEVDSEPGNGTSFSINLSIEPT
jgi:PAS domain S-box-containing protein